MALYEQIRRAHEREGLSVRELARRFGVHRRDVRQALLSPVPPARKTSSRKAPSLDRWKPTIERWLEEDRISTGSRNLPALGHFPGRSSAAKSDANHSEQPADVLHDPALERDGECEDNVSSSAQFKPSPRYEPVATSTLPSPSRRPRSRRPPIGVPRGDRLGRLIEKNRRPLAMSACCSLHRGRRSLSVTAPPRCKSHRTIRPNAASQCSPRNSSVRPIASAHPRPKYESPGVVGIGSTAR